jgi:hypothetical protein|tara:strand:- start:252 stop:428 length:177 start_codon:yes stop_codon:yes gene_type:complete
MVDPEEEQDFLVLVHFQLEQEIHLQQVPFKDMQVEQHQHLARHLAQQGMLELAEELAE